jgi:hypothetical protein
MFGVEVDGGKWRQEGNGNGEQDGDWKVDGGGKGRMGILRSSGRKMEAWMEMLIGRESEVGRDGKWREMDMGRVIEIGGR